MKSICKPFFGTQQEDNPSLTVLHPLALSTTPRTNLMEIHPTYVAAHPAGSRTGCS